MLLWGKATRSESYVSLQLRVAEKRTEAVLGLRDWALR